MRQNHSHQCLCERYERSNKNNTRMEDFEQSSSSSSSSDFDDGSNENENRKRTSVRNGFKKKKNEEKNRNGLKTSSILNKTGMSFDTSRFLDVEREREIRERGSTEAIQACLKFLEENFQHKQLTVEENLDVICSVALENFSEHILCLIDMQIDEATVQDCQKMIKKFKEKSKSFKALSSQQALLDLVRSNLQELSKTLLSGWRGQKLDTTTTDINNNNNKNDIETILDYLIETTCHECIENLCAKLDEETNIDCVVFPRLVRFARTSALKLGRETNPSSHVLNLFSKKVTQALKRGLATSEISDVIENELPAVLRAYNLRFLRDLKKNVHQKRFDNGGDYNNKGTRTNNDTARVEQRIGSLSLQDFALPSQSPESKTTRNKNGAAAETRGVGFFFGFGGTSSSSANNNNNNNNNNIKNEKQRKEEKLFMRKKAFECVRTQKSAIDAQDALLISWIRSALEVDDDFGDDDDDDDDDDDENNNIDAKKSSSSSMPSSIAYRSGLVLTGSQVVKDWQREDGFTLKRRCRHSKPDFLSKDGDPVDEDDDTDIWATEVIATGPFQAHFTRALSSLESALRRAKTCKTEESSVASAARVILAASRTARGGDELELCTNLFGDPPYFAILALNSRDYESKLNLGGPAVEIFVEEHRVVVKCCSLYEITRHPIDDFDFDNNNQNNDNAFPQPWAIIATVYSTTLKINQKDGCLKVTKTSCGLSKELNQKRLFRWWHLRNNKDFEGTNGARDDGLVIDNDNDVNNDCVDDDDSNMSSSRNSNKTGSSFFSWLF